MARQEQLLTALSTPACICRLSSDGRATLQFANAAAKRLGSLEGLLATLDAPGAKEIDFEGSAVLVEVLEDEREAPEVRAPILASHDDSAPQNARPSDQALQDTDLNTRDAIENMVWQVLLEAVPACSILLRADGKEWYVSKTAEKTFRSRPEDPWQDKATFPDHMHPMHPDGSAYQRDEYPIVRCLQNREVVRGESLRYRSHTGEERCVRVTATPVYRDGADKEMIAVTAIVEDVTDYEREQKELRQLQADREANMRVNKLKDNFVGLVSHELKTPLNGLMGLVELLRDEKGRTDRKELLGQLEAASESMAIIINNLLTLQAIQTRAHPDPVLSPCSLPDLVGRVVQVQTQRQPSGSRVKIETSFADTACHRPIMADGSRLGIALGHIISNAIRFSEPEGIVSVELTTLSAEELDVGMVAASSRYVAIRITDSGDGMNEDTRQRIFDPFFQLDSSAKRQHGGAGIGATVARAMLLAHRGDIRVIRSALGQGSVIQLFFPLVECLNRQSSQVSESATSPTSEDAYPSSSSSPNLSRRASRRVKASKILAVDDDNVNLKVMAKALEKAGYEVVTARNGLEAVEAFRADPTSFDGAVLDIMMPVMTGIDAAAQIRLTEEGFDLPLIAFTASSATDTLADCERMAMKVIQKPCPPKRLVEALKALLERQ